MSPRLAGVKLYRLSSRSHGKVGTIATTASGHSIPMDLPMAKGGGNVGPEPIETFLASLIGCKTSTAHYVARFLWNAPHNTLASVDCEIKAFRDPDGGRALPITEPPPVFPGISRIWGVVRVAPQSPEYFSADDITQLGAVVDSRCPVAATLQGGGCSIELEWKLQVNE